MAKKVRLKVSINKEETLSKGFCCKALEYLKVYGFAVLLFLALFVGEVFVAILLLHFPGIDYICEFSCHSGSSLRNLNFNIIIILPLFTLFLFIYLYRQFIIEDVLSFEEKKSRLLRHLGIIFLIYFLYNFVYPYLRIGCFPHFMCRRFPLLPANLEVFLFLGFYLGVCFKILKMIAKQRMFRLSEKDKKFRDRRFVFVIYLISIMVFPLFLYIELFILKSVSFPICKVQAVCVYDGFAKPIIYLYPTETMDVVVKLGAPEKLTHTYPKYVAEWNVQAEPSGNLTDRGTGRHYYALYWEGKDAHLPHYEDGFVVAKDDIMSFLEEKLATLGLNEREANEFIIYWLPKLESAPYTFIHFVSQEEQNINMPLEVRPAADTVIRVLMAFKSLDKSMEVKEQILPPAPVRDGFTVIEWGGTEIGSQYIY